MLRWRISWRDDSFDIGNPSALTVDHVSDQETGANEWPELTRMAEEVFARPGDREPVIARHLRPARLQLEEKPQGRLR